MRNSFELGLDHVGRKLGGLPVEVIYEDDEIKPDVGLQRARSWSSQIHVDFLVGYIWSNVLLASLPGDGRLQDHDGHYAMPGASTARRKPVLTLRVLDLVPERPGPSRSRDLHEYEEASSAVFLMAPNYTTPARI